MLWYIGKTLQDMCLCHLDTSVSVCTSSVLDSEHVFIHTLLLDQSLSFDISYLSFFLLFSLPLQVCRPMAHTDQEDVSCVQTARHSKQPRALRVRIRGGNWRTRGGRRNRGRGGLRAHSSASALQPGVPLRESRGLFGYHHHHHCPVPRLARTLRLSHPGLWRLLLPPGGHGLRQWRYGRGQAPQWWRHCSAHW